MNFYKTIQKVKELYNWTKIAQDTHFTYQKAICQTMAERQANQIVQEKAIKRSLINAGSEIINTGYDLNPIEESLDIAEKLIYDIADLL